MKTVNEMKLCVPSKSCNEAFARCVVSAFVMSLDPTVNELSDLKTAVSEAVTNCIVHGYRHQSGKIYINGKITSENKVIITSPIFLSASLFLSVIFRTYNFFKSYGCSAVGL